MNLKARLILSLALLANTLASQAAAPTILVPAPPKIDAKSYVLMDAHSGKILASHEMDMRLAPASLTKIMSLYVINNAIKNQQMTLDDQVTISRKSWKTQGSRMFVKVGSQVPAESLIKGMIVASGNDATVAMAEHIGGNEDSFVDLMNQTAQYLDMKDSHFMNATGLPQDEHYTTAADLAKLARHIIYDFPERYDWFAQKWFTYNKIKQPNRNRLLWRNASVDGLKTGHTSSAGFCLVASGFQEDTRLIAVVMGAESDEKRAEETESLLNYGFRYYSTKLIQTKEQSIAKLRIWEGQSEKVAVGIDQDVYITIIKGQAESHQVHLKLDHNVTAPIQLGQQLGTLEVEDDNNHQVLASIPLIAKEAISEGSLWQKWCDRVIRRFS